MSSVSFFRFRSVSRLLGSRIVRALGVSACLVGLMDNSASAQTFVTFAPDSVNRISGSEPDTHFSDLFSTHEGGPQRTLVETTTSTFMNALTMQAGPANGYLINSAILRVGSFNDEYVANGRVNAVLVPYDSATVTWNSFNMGGVALVDYGGKALAFGEEDDETTDWRLTDQVQAYIDGSTTNNCLFFLDNDVNSDFQFTASSNVTWRLFVTAMNSNDPTAGQAPGTLAIMGVQNTNRIFSSLSSQLSRLSVDAGVPFVQLAPQPAAASDIQLVGYQSSPVDSEQLVIRGQSPSSSWDGWITGYGVGGDVDANGGVAQTGRALRVICRRRVGLRSFEF
jgi:hypothetical protein